jgi:hypothetical protein
MYNDVIYEWLNHNNDANLNIILKKKYNNNKYFNKIFNNDITKIIFNINSPFFVRNLGNIKPNLSLNDKECHSVHNIINFFNLKGIIVGHTPQINYNINSTCSNKLFRIDIASSKAFYYLLPKLQNPEVLEIINNNINILK